MRSGRWCLIPLAATMVACQDPSLVGVHGGGTTDSLHTEHDLDDREVITAEAPPPPISGGTLIVMDDGETAVAADPDRDQVYVVDLLAMELRHTVMLSAGDEPGRLAVDADGIVHVAARRGGVLVDIDPRSGEVVERRPVCANPRGIVYDADADALHVACAGGDLVSLEPTGGAPWRRVSLGVDLRDVLVTDEGLMVTKFRSAHLLLVDDDGTVIDEHAPPNLLGEGGGRPNDELRPNTAWRTVATHDGDWLMLHQQATKRPIHIPTEDDHEHDGGYGGGDDEFGTNCGPVTPVVTLGDERYVTRSSPLLANTVLAVDVAMSHSGNRIALAVAGRSDRGRIAESGVGWISPSDLRSNLDPGCEDIQRLPLVSGQYTAVAFDPQGNIVAFSREPAKLDRIDPWTGTRQLVELSDDSRKDSGHDLFHRDAGEGISCATCHAEGGDDGHIWNFVGVGARHTPALNAGLRGSEPFHWEGDLPDMHALMEDVLVRRMGGQRLSAERVDALAEYVFSMPAPIPRRAPTDLAATRGKTLFATWGCDTCHQGASGVGGPDGAQEGFAFEVQIPPLRGVASHPPFMHDGRALTLSDAVLDMLERTQPQMANPSADDLADMVAYLESR
ncbi:MAG: c-type cytochrome [Deltaproteobacteria bacterium]|nr:c-type cytochrome [Deltaproteobacteria bacterium]